MVPFTVRTGVRIPVGTPLLNGSLRAIQFASWRAKSLLQNQNSLLRSFSDRGEWNAGIKGDKPSFVLNRESKQVNVGQLSRSMNSGRIHDVRIQQTDFVWPEFMDILVASLG